MRTREIAGIFNTFDEIYLIFTEKSQYPLFIVQSCKLFPFVKSGEKLMVIVSFIKQAHAGNIASYVLS